MADSTADDNKHLKFKVFVRLRPVSNDPGTSPAGVCSVEHRIITLKDPSKDHQSEFVFDGVFKADASQESVFDTVGKPLVHHAVQGYNACAFAYGQTGSGKTFTMLGKEELKKSEHELRGLMPRAAEEVFRAAQEGSSQSPVRFSFFVSFLEIYLEQVRDLGRGALMRQEVGAGKALPRQAMEEWARSDLDVWEDTAGNTTVKGLTYIEVKSPAEVLEVLRDGTSFRSTASTAQNDVSSRSHTIFTLSVVQRRDGQRPITGRLHLVDLAGSERLTKSHSEGQRLTEAKAINKSLTALGKVVTALLQESSEGSKPHHVPFRDTKLTRLLKDSLQGNSLTYMLAALNPLPDNADECFNTLQFAVRCQAIQVVPQMNIVGGPDGGGGADEVDGASVQELKAQLAGLQEELDFTHAHYQKILESAAGPNWSANMGALERMPGAFEAGAADARRTSAASSDNSGDVNPTPRGMAAVGNPGGPGDPRTKRLEAGLATAQAVAAEVQVQLEKKKLEYDEMRDRLLAKDSNQFSEIRKLRAKVVELQGQLLEQQADTRFKLDEALKASEAEAGRLARDNLLLREQLATMSTAVQGIMTQRLAKATSEQRAQEAIKGEADRKLQLQVAQVAAEKERQLGNLKAQSSAFMRSKAQQASMAEAQLQAMQSAVEAAAMEVAGVQAEAEQLAAYSERMTELLRLTDAGAGKLRPFQPPPRAQPAAPDSERVRYLATRVQAAQRLLEATRQSHTVRNASMDSLEKPSTGALQPGATMPGALTAGRTDGEHADRDRNAWSAPSSQRRSMPFSRSSAGLELPAPVPGALGPELEAQRLQWQAMKAQFTLNGVAQTADGKKQLLDYVSGLEQAVVQARRREADLTVALRSAQRRPQSALQQVISGHLAPGQMPVWGPGHSKGYSLPPSRPATASTQGGPMLSRSHGASMTRPSSTQPTIQVLSALFQDQGLTS